MTERDDGDFLDSGVTQEPPAYGVPVDRPASRWTAALRPAAWLAAGVVAGVVVVSAWHSSTATAPNASPAAAQGQLPGGPGGPGFGGGPGGGPGGPGGGPGFGGGRPGEQHVQGVVTAVGAASVTVRLDGGGTTTYAVVASSDIGKNGSRVPLSAIKPGDAVVLHVYPLNGKTVVEHLFARGA
ncbi:MAG: hypothetical protein QOD07_2849 [Frankiaceae bacterium]|nr:hypothetical protein [Frankiaceae bacterium]